MTSPRKADGQRRGGLGAKLVGQSFVRPARQRIEAREGSDPLDLSIKRDVVLSSIDRCNPSEIMVAGQTNDPVFAGISAATVRTTYDRSRGYPLQRSSCRTKVF
jgi:hypothetical protein